MPKGPKKEPERIVRRPPAERKRLAPDLEEFAHGTDERIRGPRSGPRLRDPRAIALIPGVANRDARTVFDHRLTVLERAVRERDETVLGRGLSEMIRTGLWRGGALTGFDALVENVLGLDYAFARELAKKGAAERGTTLVALSDEAIAIWIRAEAALLEANAEGSVDVRVTGRREELVIEVLATHAGAALAAMGRKAVSLREELAPLPPRRPPLPRRDDRR